MRGRRGAKRQQNQRTEYSHINSPSARRFSPPCGHARIRNKNHNRNREEKADNLEKMHLAVNVVDTKSKTKRHWEASLTNDLSFFMYPSLVVGSMKQERPMWKLREENLKEEDMNDPLMKISKALAHPVLDEKMTEGEGYLRKKMRGEGGGGAK